MQISMILRSNIPIWYINNLFEQCIIYSIGINICSPSSNNSESMNFFVAFIKILKEWACQTYEGNRITFSIGCNNKKKIYNNINIDDILYEDFLKVLTSGYDTLIICHGNGEIIGYEQLKEESKEINIDSFFPIYFSLIANWSLSNDFALSLNKNGEILVFHKGNIKFAYRREQWIYFSHELYIKDMQMENCSAELCKEVYLSALDVSFRRSGGCIGIISKNKYNEHKNLIGENDILINDKNTPKQKFFMELINKYEKFQNIPRKIRQEIIGIDGATIIDETGKLLCIGAILHITGGSTGGGGRTAAAKAIARHGLGIKISNDGKIQYWKNISESEGAPLPKHTIG